MAFQSTEQFYKIKNSAVVSGPTRQTGFGENVSDRTLATYGWYRLWIDDGGASPGPFYQRESGPILVDEVTNPPRCTRVDTWTDISSEAKRERLLSDIDSQRRAMDRPQIDVQEDPGLSGLMDEANISAADRRSALGRTDDADLDTFDSALNPLVANSIQLAASLSRQERSILASANPFTEQQRSDLSAAATQHEAIVDAGDPAAAVPEVPSFARRLIGVIGEDYGTILANRPYSAGWYWLELELRTKRELDTTEYWFSIYDGTAPDDRDDSSGSTTGYLTAARMTETAPGVYTLDRAAINLPRSTPDEIFKFVLCRGHISFPQFDKLTLAAGDLFGEYRARWHGMV